MLSGIAIDTKSVARVEGASKNMVLPFLPLLFCCLLFVFVFVLFFVVFVFFCFLCNYI